MAPTPLLAPLPAQSPSIRAYAFADDIAIAAHDIPSIFPALHLIDSFSSVSGLGINKDKSCVICTSDPSTYPSVETALRAGPWPDLPLKPSALHLGIPIGRLVTLGDIFAKPLEKALRRLSAHHNIVRPLSLPNRILYVNTFIVSIFSYHMLFFLLPMEYYKQLVTAIRRLVIPYNGTGFTYSSLVCSNSLWHVRPALKDLWAFNLSLLAVRSPIIHSTANFNSLPLILVNQTKFISDHRDVAAIDFGMGVTCRTVP